MSLTADIFKAIEPHRERLDAIIEALPGAVIAGGYLRDTVVGRPTRDMDIFVWEHSPNGDELAALQRLFGCEFLPQLRPVLTDYAEEEPQRTSDIRAVWKGFSEGALLPTIPVDIIAVTDVMTHIREFPDNISKIWYDENGLTLTSDFIYGHANKVIKYRDSAGGTRLDKLLEKYPDYKVERQ